MSNLYGKRREIREAVIEALKYGKAKFSAIEAIAKRITLDELFEKDLEVESEGWLIPKLFDVFQGVTWGGQGCKDIYVVDKKLADRLEPEMVYKTIGGGDINNGNIKWLGEYLVFPYIVRGKKWIRAFLSPSLGGIDSLDFTVNIDDFEKGKDVKKKLNYRIAKGLIPYPETAIYLLKQYERLATREFENKTLQDYNKSWYEYHRPRKPVLISQPKIVCKRMMKYPSFALDEEGYIPKDSVMSLIPKNNINELKEELEKVLGKTLNIKEVLLYVLAFLNSELFSEILSKKRSKKRGGYPIVGKKMLNKFCISKPKPNFKEKIKAIINGEKIDFDPREL